MISLQRSPKQEKGVTVEAGDRGAVIISDHDYPMSSSHTAEAEHLGVVYLPYVDAGDKESPSYMNDVGGKCGRHRRLHWSCLEARYSVFHYL